MKKNKILWFLLIVVSIVIVILIANKDNIAYNREIKQLNEQIEFDLDMYELQYGTNEFVIRMRRQREIMKKYNKQLR